MIMISDAQSMVGIEIADLNTCFTARDEIDCKKGMGCGDSGCCGVRCSDLRR